MPRNGSGTYARAETAYVYNTIIDQDAVNNEMDDIATALTASLAKDGQTVPTANLPMGTYKLTGLGAGTGNGDSVRYEQLVLKANIASPAFTGVVSFAKGADVASANALTLGADGNYFDITGTTAITSIGTKGVGTVIKLHFDGALTLTHHATDLILPGGANITTAAGMEAEFIEYATGDWRMTGGVKADGTAFVASAVSTATQADQETGSSTTAFVTPGRQQFHPSACKFFVSWDNAGGINGNAYNVTSVTDSGVGQFTVNITTAFSSANWVGHFDAVGNAGARTLLAPEAIGTSTFTVGSRNLADSAYADATGPYFAFGFGDQ